MSSTVIKCKDATYLSPNATSKFSIRMSVARLFPDSSIFWSFLLTAWLADAVIVDLLTNNTLNLDLQCFLVQFFSRDA